MNAIIRNAAVIPAIIIAFIIWRVNDLDKFGPIGDFVSGIFTPILTLSSVLMAYWLFKAQQKSSDVQNDRAHFFDLMSVAGSVCSDISIRKINKSSGTESFTTGKSAFSNLFYRYRRAYNANTSTNEDEKMQSAFKELYSSQGSKFGHYFRLIYNILEFLNTSKMPYEEQKKLSDLLRATLNRYEMVVLFYNILGKKEHAPFKKLVENFEFLKGMDEDLLLISSHKKHFSPKGFGEKEA